MKIYMLSIPLLLIGALNADQQCSMQGCSLENGKKPVSSSQKPKPAAQQQNESNENEDDFHTKEILQNFAQVVTNFGKIVLNPKDAEQVESGICNMIAGTLGMITQAMRNGLVISKEDALKVLSSLDATTQIELMQLFSNNRSSMGCMCGCATCLNCCADDGCPCCDACTCNK